MSAVVEPMTRGEREAAKQDAVTEVARLGALITSLEADVNGDPVIAAELADLRSGRDAARAELRKLLEMERLEKQASEAQAGEAAERRQAQLRLAKDLGQERRLAAKTFDQHLRQAAIALAGYHRLCQEQANALTDAGSKQAADAARPKAHRVTCALTHALHESRVPRGAIDLPSVSPTSVQSLLDADPIAI